ncbi:hypothetical protein [Streptomyces sp. NPDC008122]|uniref:hypothetical protein n=1 Tax=Streptomyces sp. NPDC008122 TaxID=3364810 RepID=UPI0036F03CB3
MPDLPTALAREAVEMTNVGTTRSAAAQLLRALIGSTAHPGATGQQPGRAQCLCLVGGPAA